MFRFPSSFGTPEIDRKCVFLAEIFFFMGVLFSKSYPQDLFWILSVEK